jgi:hypothetical protein
MYPHRNEQLTPLGLVGPGAEDPVSTILWASRGSLPDKRRYPFLFLAQVR